MTAQGWTTCVVLLGVALGLPGCLDDERSETLLPSPIVMGPVDSVERGQLAEGDEVAFGLRLPRDSRVTSRMPDAVEAVGRLPFEAAANYVRDRVAATRVETGPRKTLFVMAKVKGSERVVQVEVIDNRGKVLIVVRDRTKRPAEEGLSEEERWRRAGLTPDGQVIDGE